jgi:hypothetical protein
MSITVTSGERYIVSSGQIDTGDVVDFDGGLTVFRGGTIINTTVFGAVDVQGSASASGTVVQNGGFEEVEGETDLREIALRGYAGAASTNWKAREAAVAVFVSDQCFNLATDKRGGCGATSLVAAQRLQRNRRLRRNATCDDVTKHRQPRAPEPPPSLACPVRSLRPAPAA